MLGTSSTAVLEIPHERAERKLVPIPKQMMRALRGGVSWKARGRCAIIFVIGVRTVIPTPFTAMVLSMPRPKTVTVAVESRLTIVSG
jgi:hypothetical protein